MKLRFKKLKSYAKIPVTVGNTMELYACLEKEFTLSPGEAAIVSTGVSFKKIEGYEAEIRPTKNLSEHAIAILDPTGSVNYDDVVILIINHSRGNFTVENGMCIGELAVSIAPVRCFIEEEIPGFEDSEVKFAISESASRTDFYTNKGYVPYAEVVKRPTPTRDEIMDELERASMGKK